MTRINCVPVKTLHYKHLIAEYRELPRIFALVRKRQEKNFLPEECNIPKEYTLGRGHVTFFYDKLDYLIKRQKDLIQEMLHRGYNPTNTTTDELLEGINTEWINDWVPDSKAIVENTNRINERLNTMKEK